MTQPGELDQRVAIQARSQSDDGLGGGVTSWATVATRWAKVKPLSGRERRQGEQLEDSRDYRVTLRRDETTAAIGAAHRLVWRGAALNIRFIADAGDRPLYLEIDCERGVA